MSEITVKLTNSELNRLTELLRVSAVAKKKRAKEVDPNDRDAMIAAAMSDYELRKKLIAAKVGSFPELDC